MTGLERKVADYIKKYKMIEDGEEVILAVSGGADSTALFYLMLAYGREHKLSFHIAHLDHMLRGEAAERDSRFVEAMCRKEGLPFYLEKIDVAGKARERRLSLEEAGRLCRYDFFRRLADSLGVKKIALAHHKQDLAETMLFNLARGSGIAGLCSLKPVQGDRIRPLLAVNREEIENYLEEKGLSWMEDASNQEDAYSRNCIRNKVLPVLTGEINRRTVDHMAALSEDLGKLLLLGEDLGRKALKKYGRKVDGGWFLADSLREEADILLTTVIRLCLGDVSFDLKDISRRHIVSLKELYNKAPGARLDLPGDLEAYRRYDGIWMGRSWQRKKRDVKKENELLEPGKNYEEKKISISCRELSYPLAGGEKIPEDQCTKWIDCDRIIDTLVIRKRKRGDYITINNKGGRKKLKDFFIDRKIPREERDEILLLADGQEVVWIPGYRFGHSHRVSEDTKKVWEIKVELKGE